MSVDGSSIHVCSEPKTLEFAGLLFLSYFPIRQCYLFKRCPKSNHMSSLPVPLPRCKPRPLSPAISRLLTGLPGCHSPPYSGNGILATVRRAFPHHSLLLRGEGSWWVAGLLLTDWPSGETRGAWAAKLERRGGLAPGVCVERLHRSTLGTLWKNQETLWGKLFIDNPVAGLMPLFPGKGKCGFLDCRFSR